MPPSLKQMLAKKEERHRELRLRRASSAISPRENQIIRCVEGGMTNTEIGLHLGISVETVKRHLGNIFDKLGCSNRTEMVVMRRGKLMSGYVCEVCLKDVLIHGPGSEAAEALIRFGENSYMELTACPTCVIGLRAAVDAALADLRGART